MVKIEAFNISFYSFYVSTIAGKIHLYVMQF